MAIQLIDEYKKYIERNGVGSNDLVADSVKSYCNYLQSISEHLSLEISPKTISDEDDILSVKDRLQAETSLSTKTITNYLSALRQYVRMIKNIQ